MFSSKHRLQVIIMLSLTNELGERRLNNLIFISARAYAAELLAIASDSGTRIHFKVNMIRVYNRQRRFLAFLDFGEVQWLILAAAADDKGVVKPRRRLSCISHEA